MSGPNIKRGDRVLFVDGGEWGEVLKVFTDTRLGRRKMTIRYDNGLIIPGEVGAVKRIKRDGNEIPLQATLFDMDADDE